MATMQQLLVLTLTALLFCIFTVPAVFANEGTATFYTPPYTPSSCDGFQNDGVMIGSASEAIWDNGGACGRTYTVTCIGGTNNGVPQPCTGASVTVTIVDFCPNCRGTIDLSQEAFATIANPDAGKILISF